MGESRNLDIIRAVAVMAVVLRHVLGGLGIEFIGPVQVQFIGIFGVLLFFVHTAHVLMWSLQRMAQESDDQVYRRFLVRRAFRIYPLSMAVILFGSAVTGLWRAVPGFRNLAPPELVANLLLVQNLTGSPNALAVLWSLPLEVQMYMFLPAIYHVVRGGSLVMLGAIYLGGLVLAVAAFKLPIPDVFKFFPCFIPGILAYLLVKRWGHRPLPFWLLPMILLIAGALYQVLARWSQTIGGYLPCLLVALAIVTVQESKLARLNFACNRVARYSYGIYLIHGPALELAFMIPVSPPVRVVAFLTATWGLSVAAYHLIEAPLVKFGHATSRPPLRAELNVN